MELHDVVGFTQPLHVEGTRQLVLIIGQHTLGIHLFGHVQLDHTQIGGAQSKTTRLQLLLEHTSHGNALPGACELHICNLILGQ